GAMESKPTAKSSRWKRRSPSAISNSRRKPRPALGNGRDSRSGTWPPMARLSIPCGEQTESTTGRRSFAASRSLGAVRPGDQQCQRVGKDLHLARQMACVLSIDLHVDAIIRCGAESGFARPENCDAAHAFQSIGRDPCEVFQIAHGAAAGEQHYFELVVPDAH